MNRREMLTLELREDIGTAILELMKEKPLDKITVDEFSERANVGRATFYRQFSSKEEAIAYKLSHDFLKYEKDEGISFETTSPQKYAEAFFEFIYSLKDTNQLLIKNNCEHCILDAMKYSFQNINNTTDSHEFYRDHFRAYGLLGIVTGWIEADYDLSIQDIAKLTVEYFYKI